MTGAIENTEWSYVEFGTQLRRRRRANDLTQEALARKADCSEHTVKKLEHGLRRPSRAMAVSLADALGLPPAEQDAFITAGTGARQHDTDASGTSDVSSVGDVNPVTTILGAETMTVHCWNRFVGRSGDIEAVLRLFERSRLITLHGPGGVGKSRLAAEIARRYSSGLTLWVEFKHLDGRNSVDTLIARSLQAGSASMPPRQAVAARLGSDDWLVVLDNCEGRIDDIASLCSDLLDCCPHIRILVASRVLTHLTGEMRWPLRGLATSGVGAPAGTRPSDAVALFLDRAGSANPALSEMVDSGAEETAFERLDSVTLHAVESICRHLDGLPLAIELAAARVDLYPPAILAHRIHQDRRFLSTQPPHEDPRYSNLVEMVQWSYELLQPEERLCLRAASTFRGSFGIDSAHAVASPGTSLREFEQTFGNLVRSSLVSRAKLDSSDFHVVETIRAVVSEMIGPSEEQQFRRRHAQHFAHRAELAWPDLWGGRAHAALASLARHHADYVAATEWACETGDAQTARRLTGALFRYWDIHGHLLEGLELCRQACAVDGDAQPEIDARAANGLGTLSILVGDGETAVPAFERALSIAAESALGREQSYALTYLGLCAAYEDDPHAAGPLLLAAVRVARQSNEPAMEGWAHVFLAAAHMRLEDFDSAHDSLSRAFALLNGVDDEGTAWSIVGLSAHALMTRRDPCLDEVTPGLLTFIEMRAGWGTSVAGMLAGISAVRLGQLELASRLLKTTDRLRILTGATNLPAMNRLRLELVAAVGPTGHLVDTPDDSTAIDEGDPLELIHDIDGLFHDLTESGSYVARHSGK
jgi:predicted ATPase/transcriptional regulator with XRE-family HTH domain